MREEGRSSMSISVLMHCAKSLQNPGKRLVVLREVTGMKKAPEGAF